MRKRKHYWSYDWTKKVWNFCIVSQHFLVLLNESRFKVQNFNCSPQSERRSTIHCINQLWNMIWSPCFVKMFIFNLQIGDERSNQYMAIKVKTRKFVNNWTEINLYFNFSLLVLKGFVDRFDQKSASTTGNNFLNVCLCPNSLQFSRNYCSPCSSFRLFAADSNNNNNNNNNVFLFKENRVYNFYVLQIAIMLI